jgi:hypothetical protein
MSKSLTIVIVSGPLGHTHLVVPHRQADQPKHLHNYLETEIAAIENLLGKDARSSSITGPERKEDLSQLIKMCSAMNLDIYILPISGDRLATVANLVGYHRLDEDEAVKADDSFEQMAT